MTRKTTTTQSPIPKFKSREEEAVFWDAHSTADFEDEFRPVTVRFAKNLSEGITIRLDTETMTTLRTRARDKGIGPTTLIRMWVLERLGKEAGLLGE